MTLTPPYIDLVDLVDLVGVGGEGQDTSRHFEGPCVQYCPCEASEQKLGQKPKSEIKEIELS